MAIVREKPERDWHSEGYGDRIAGRPAPHMPWGCMLAPSGTLTPAAALLIALPVPF